MLNRSRLQGLKFRRLAWHLMAMMLLILLTANANSNEPTKPQFDLPLQCSPGIDCWIANYPDVDPKVESVSDYVCDGVSYDGHEGTDFAIRDLKAMHRGVSVLSAAQGTVLRMRNNEPDGPSELLRERARGTGRECGNGVVIDHGNGWQTQYCHLRRRSISVTSGQFVEQGTTLGLVGASGDTEFPHLHFQVTFNGHVIDPFSGKAIEQGCENTGEGLWTKVVQENLRHIYPVVFNTGFSNSIPNQQGLMEGRYDESNFSCNSPMLLMWFEAFWVRSGDHMEYTIIAPDESVWHNGTVTFAKSQAKVFRYVGQRLRSRCFQEGTYRAALKMVRDGRITSERQISVSVSDLE